MERLQEALSRARTRRQEIQANAAAGARMADATAEAPTRNRTVAPAVAEAWAALPQAKPNERAMRANRVVSYFGGAPAAPYDMLRTKLLHQIRTNNWRRIVITSPSPGCGKTTIAANLALSLARQTDLRVIVVEIDLRRPQMANLLGLRTRTAFAKVLSGEEPAADHLVAFGENLAFATSHTPAPNASELLHSARAREAIAQIEATYAPDIILFDSSPMLASDDTVGFLNAVDAALLVAAAEQTSIDEVDVTEAEIAAITNVAGVVLNKTRYGSGSHSYEEQYY